MLDTYENSVLDELILTKAFSVDDLFGNKLDVITDWFKEDINSEEIKLKVVTI